MNLHLLLLVLRQRWQIALGMLLLTTLVGIIVTLLLPKTYTATASVLVDVKDDQTSQPGQPVYLQPGYLETQSDIIASRKVATRVVKNMKMADSAAAREAFAAAGGNGTIEDWLVDRLLLRLNVNRSHSSVMQIEYSAPEPRFAAAIANAFADAYIDTNLELRVEPARHASQWFDEQLKQLRINLEQAQKRLTQYQQKYGMPSANEQSDVENSRHAALSAQLVQIQADTYEALSKQKQVEEFIARGSPLESLPEVLSNPFIQKLKSDLVAQEAKLFEYQNQYGQNHPHFRQQQADVTELKTKLDTEIHKVLDATRNSLNLRQQREADVRASLSNQKSHVLNLKSEHDELAVLTRDVDSAQQAYDETSKRFRQSNLDSQASKTNVTLLSAAIPPQTPSRPKVALNIFAAVVIGALLGITSAVLLEFFDRRVRSSASAIQELGLPLLGRLGKPRQRSRWAAWFPFRREVTAV